MNAKTKSMDGSHNKLPTKIHNDTQQLQRECVSRHWYLLFIVYDSDISLLTFDGQSRARWEKLQVEQMAASDFDMF